MSPGSIRIVRCRREKQEMQRSGRFFFSPIELLEENVRGRCCSSENILREIEVAMEIFVVCPLYRNRYIEVGISEENLALVKTNDQKKGNGEEEEKASSFLP